MIDHSLYPRLLTFCAIVVLSGCSTVPEGAQGGGTTALAQQREPAAAEPKREEEDPTKGWQRANLVSLADGAQIELRIQSIFALGGKGTGKLAATNSKTGEKFTGQRTAIKQGVKSGRGTVTSSYGTHIGNVNYTESSNTASWVGTLVGDKGTVIQLQVQSTTGFSKHGIGSGEDNKGNRYQVQY